MKVAATLNVNGILRPVEIERDASLLDAVREEIGLTGAKDGCDTSVSCSARSSSTGWCSAASARPEC